MTDLPQAALSIRQPWAWAILHAGKDTENRDWHTTYRGPVCLHASKGCTRFEYDDFLDTLRLIGETQAGASLPRPPRLIDLQRGGIVGTVEIVDCVMRSASPWFFGRFGFVLQNPQPIDFIPVKGALGFFDWRRNLNV